MFWDWTSKTRRRDAKWRLTSAWATPSMHPATCKRFNGLLCCRTRQAGVGSLDAVSKESMIKFCKFGDAVIRDIAAESEHRGDEGWGVVIVFLNSPHEICSCISSGNSVWYARNVVNEVKFWRT